MEENSGYVLAMYDVRGIQNYIFRTPQVKDAIGASAIVEDIILEALQDALDKLGIKGDADLEWRSEQGPKPYQTDETKKLHLLYIGGGNGLLLFESRELCREINKHMAKYVLEKTYSLQLAVAIVAMGNNYEEDREKLNKEMDRVKAEMVSSRPLGALPVMEVEAKTGYPVSKERITKSEKGEQREKMGTESDLKQSKEQKVRNSPNSQIKKFENYITEKGKDSTLAVVHIDGNNMGLRIRKLMEGIADYQDAVKRMRQISFNISHSYQTVFEQMQDYFNEKAGGHEEFKNKETENFVLKILVAGDDITYVCNGKIALATVDYFCRNISNYKEYSMVKGVSSDEEKLKKYSFSVCAGISYIRSHFPFYVGYEVAEACCSNAKKLANKEQYKENGRVDGRVGNWIDFHICQNVQAQDLEAMRKREYMTSHNEQLLRRPYFFCTGEEGWPITEGSSQSFNQLKSNILYFQDETNIPRSFAKNLRNIYPMGENQVVQFKSFLESRNWKMPGDGSYYEEKMDGNITVAKWYDALEMMDYYIDLDQIEEESDETVSNED